MEWIILIFIAYFLYHYNKGKSMTSEHNDEVTFFGESHNEYSEFEKSGNKSNAKWISPNEEITIGKKTVANGLFYFGGVLKDEKYGGTESSLVDDWLSIKDKPYTFTDYTLGYWPSFQSLSSNCRGAYIDWLASDRDMPDVPIGYLFIYFYGLERRILNDYNKGMATDEECFEICNEVLRLRSIFKDNYSFNSYSSSLLDYVSITYPNIFYLSDDDIENSIYSDLFKVKLAYIAKNGEPLSPELAYAWIKSHPDYNLRTPARRCPDEFKALFMLKYKEIYQQGMLIKPNKTKLRLGYRPASGSLNYFTFGPSGLCDPTVLSAPVKKLADIAMQCTDELDAYSRYLGKQDTSRDDMEAAILLPIDLIDEFDIPLIHSFKLWAENIIEKKEGVCSFKDLWLHTKLPLPTKVNKKEQNIVCSLIEKSGYSLAPHPVLHGSKFNLDDPIVIYKQESTIKIENSAVFDDVAIKIRLGSIIANADLKIHTNEVSFLKNIIHSNDNLMLDEKLSLEAYLQWLLKAPSSFNGLKSSMSKLRDSDREVVRKMIIYVALSDGKIDPSEVTEIEKLYTTLGLDKSTVPADIHSLSLSRKEIAHEVNDTPVEDEKRQSFTLDDSVLNIHEMETKNAQKILKDIFNEEDEADSEENVEIITEETLENKALAIYKIISEQDIVKRADFEKICTEHGFFVDSAIDSINEWSFDKVDAPVIEDGTDIIIDREVADELREVENI